MKNLPYGIAFLTFGAFLEAVSPVSCVRPDASEVRPVKSGHRDKGQLGKDLLCTVDGVAISISEVEKVVSTSQLNPREGLRRLQSERLLMAEAQREGFDTHPEVRRVAAQAAVQALIIDELEKQIEVTQEQIERAYRESSDRFHEPEVRKTMHVVARMGKDVSRERDRAGENFIRNVIRRTSMSPDPLGILKSYEAYTHEKFEVGVKSVPYLTEDSRFAPEYIEAVLHAEQGLIPHPVRTPFGWYAIMITGIKPERVIPLSQVEDMLRKQILREMRERRLREIIAAIRNDYPVIRNHSAIERLLSSELFDNGSP